MARDQWLSVSSFECPCDSHTAYGTSHESMPEQAENLRFWTYHQRPDHSDDWATRFISAASLRPGGSETCNLHVVSLHDWDHRNLHNIIWIPIPCITPNSIMNDCSPSRRSRFLLTPTIGVIHRSEYVHRHETPGVYIGNAWTNVRDCTTKPINSKPNSSDYALFYIYATRESQFSPAQK
jgi:hypothetical protein